MQLVLPKGKVMTTHAYDVVFSFLHTGPFLKVDFFRYRMEITVNQQHYQVAEACSMQDLITIVLNKPATGIAVAVNQTIIPKTNWENHLLCPGDHVIIIKATPGG
ncbi:MULTISPECIES: sulfur carrier protein ThiS [unclassified Pedobacter]|nr:MULTISPECIES: sulfur carrier protein ThiS [unclassified Pedobacter]MCX2430115.1 sulfur carrier protein ThiS [Pedobacter sp. GR22-10]